MGSLEQMRERAAPSMWTCLDPYAGSRSSTKIESPELNDEEPDSAPKAWSGCQVRSNSTAANIGGSDVHGKRRTRYA